MLESQENDKPENPYKSPSENAEKVPWITGKILLIIACSNMTIGWLLKFLSYEMEDGGFTWVKVLFWAFGALNALCLFITLIYSLYWIVIVKARNSKYQ